jgi:predicted Zn-dependent peptidase
MLNRQQQPHYSTIEKIDIIRAKRYDLQNGIPIHYIDAGETDVVKIECLFPAGSWNAQNPLTAQFTNAALKEGTSNSTSVEIADKLDFYGAYLGQSSGKHTSSLSLYTLNKHLKNTLQIFFDILQNAIFPEDEIQTIINQSFQNFLIGKQKTSQIASEEMMQALFGNNHPYGIIVTENHFKSLNTQILSDFYTEKYRPEFMKIVVSGKIEETLFNDLNNSFGMIHLNGHKEETISNINPVTSDKRFLFYEKNDAKQVSIRAGKLSINKYHEDFLKLKIVTTILGGYFGSRLMKNIREDKGYTYGIGCDVHSYQKAGMYWLHAETGYEVYEKAIEEIKNEIRKLRTELIDTEELNRVRNYMLGEILRGVTGAFALADIYISLAAYGLSYNYYERYLQLINTMKPEEIREICEKYLHEDSLTFVAAGRKN